MSGRVNNPSSIKYTNGMTMKDAVDAADGAVSLSALKRVYLFRNGGRYIYNLTNPTHQKEKVYPSDVITVGSSVSEIKVQGAVSRPGPVPYMNGMTLYDAIQAAGDTSAFEFFKGIKYCTEGKTYNLDIMTEEGLKRILVSPGDKIIVPEEKAEPAPVPEPQ